MPTPVACPSCGVDGTDAANAVIAQNLGPQPAAAVAPVRVTPHVTSTPAQPNVAVAESTPSAPRRSNLLKRDPAQVESEARAKIMWGDSREAVTQHMIMNGFSREDATSMVKAMFDDRAATIRGIGTGKILKGFGLICVPIVAWIYFMSIRFLPYKLFALTVMAGLYGVYIFIQGMIMFLAPKSEPGDVADQ